MGDIKTYKFIKLCWNGIKWDGFYSLWGTAGFVQVFYNNNNNKHILEAETKLRIAFKFIPCILRNKCLLEGCW